MWSERCVGVRSPGSLYGCSAFARPYRHLLLAHCFVCLPCLPRLQIVNHMKLRHPHIIGLREVFLTGSHLVLAMEYAAGGDLFRYVSSRRGLPEDEARWFFQQLMVAVDYCHRMVSAWWLPGLHMLVCVRGIVKHLPVGRQMHPSS